MKAFLEGTSRGVTRRDRCVWYSCCLCQRLQRRATRKGAAGISKMCKVSPGASCRQAAANEPDAAGVWRAYDVVPSVDFSPGVFGHLP